MPSLVGSEMCIRDRRYAARRSAGDCSQPPCQLHWKTQFARSKRSSGLPRGNGVGGRNLSFALPPVMCRVSSNDAKVMLEASPSGAPTAAGSIWQAVATIEERNGSRFFVVDSQPIILRGGVPTILFFSELHAGTDHRVQLSWNVCKPKGQRFRERSHVRGDKQRRRTLRFTTLSETSNAINGSPSPMGTSPTLSPGWKSDIHARRSIHVITATSSSYNALLRSSPLLSGSTDVKGLKQATTTGRNVSVVISHQLPTSLELTDEYLDMKPWRGIPRPPNGNTSSERSSSVMPSRPQNDRPLTRASDQDVSLSLIHI